jgi:UDP-3-O-[3-hydroxymyristoyl] N-acetylglucosamine deacetylase
LKQRTLKRDVIFEGIGVHSGVASCVILKPAPKDFGIVFANPLFPDSVFKIGSVIPEVAMQATVLKNDKWILSTTEHLLAAIIGVGLDNVLIQISGPGIESVTGPEHHQKHNHHSEHHHNHNPEHHLVEIPIMDGSAVPFVHGILDCGFQEQDAAKKYLTPKQALKFEDSKSGRFIEIHPAQVNVDQNYSTNLNLSYTADFAHKLVGNSQLDCLLTQEFFANEIAPARTFGFLEQLPQMRKLGIAKGTSLGNTVVLSNEGFLNETRFEDECIRHKVLDLIGDLSLLGLPLTGKVIAAKTGHSFNREVIVHYISNPDLWRVEG